MHTSRPAPAPSSGGQMIYQLSFGRIWEAPDGETAWDKTADPPKQEILEYLFKLNERLDALESRPGNEPNEI
jgi:hypothetical protein